MKVPIPPKTFQGSPIFLLVLPPCLTHLVTFQPHPRNFHFSQTPLSGVIFVLAGRGFLRLAIFGTFFSFLSVLQRLAQKTETSLLQ